MSREVRSMLGAAARGQDLPTWCSGRSFGAAGAAYRPTMNIFSCASRPHRRHPRRWL